MHALLQVWVRFQGEQSDTKVNLSAAKNGKTWVYIDHELDEPSSEEEGEESGDEDSEEDESEDENED